MQTGAFKSSLDQAEALEQQMSMALDRRWSNR
jgi:hypothetical protein